MTDALWSRYRATGDADARAQLLDKYLGLVHHAAREFTSRTPALELGDLLGAGTLGLMRALDTFDLSRGLAFSTYAMTRIRGSILDDLRARDWTPRSVRSKSRQHAAAVARLEGQLGRAPKPREIAGALGIDLPAYWTWVSTMEGTSVVSIHESPMADNDGGTLEETLDNPEAELPGEAIEAEEQREQLRVAIAELPDKERKVLALYFFEELTLKQIGEVLKLTESRVCQIRTQTLRKLRARLSPAGREASRVA
ncbi:MAG TPA: FliA/WhiG family RNA polymerase sigma factor [Gemmatimonadaceae bacterium]|nr:FliA/WhiG family RNA polymerase sigma factor [Gemmatimonadaceae bacterium]